MVADRKWAVFGVVVLLVLAGFIAANKFWFYPEYTVQIQAPPLYTSPDDIPKIVLIKPFAGTLKEIIHQDDLVNKNSADFANGRNPFLWQGELQPKQKDAGPEVIIPEQPVEIPRLGMIIIGSRGKSVMLDTTLVHKGESYGGHVVEEIESKSVVLSGEYGVLKISMSARSFGEPSVDILEVTNPDMLIKPVLSKKTQR